jgi:hypothetical protein
MERPRAGARKAIVSIGHNGKAASWRSPAAEASLLELSMKSARKLLSPIMVVSLVIAAGLCFSQVSEKK